MAELTQKQKENRAYYARHAEKLRAKKREAHQKAKTNKPSTTKPAKHKKPIQKKQIHLSNSDKPPDLKLARNTVTPEAREKCKARRRIEDWHLARELELESF